MMYNHVFLAQQWTLIDEKHFQNKDGVKLKAYILPEDQDLIDVHVQLNTVFGRMLSLLGQKFNPNFKSFGTADKLTLPPDKESSVIEFIGKERRNQVLSLVDNDSNIVQWFLKSTKPTPTRWTKGLPDKKGWFTLSYNEKYLTGSSTSTEPLSLKGMYITNTYTTLR